MKFSFQSSFWVNGSVYENPFRHLRKNLQSNWTEWLVGAAQSNRNELHVEPWKMPLLFSSRRIHPPDRIQSGRLIHHANGVAPKRKEKRAHPLKPSLLLSPSWWFQKSQHLIGSNRTTWYGPTFDANLVDLWTSNESFLRQSNRTAFVSYLAINLDLLYSIDLILRWYQPPKIATASRAALGQFRYDSRNHRWMFTNSKVATECCALGSAHFQPRETGRSELTRNFTSPLTEDWHRAVASTCVKLAFNKWNVQ